MRRIVLCLTLMGCQAEPTCQEQANALSQRLGVGARVERRCGADGDCMMHSVDLSCLQSGPVAIATSGAPVLEAGLVDLEARCTRTSKASGDSFQTEDARCLDGWRRGVMRDGG